MTTCRSCRPSPSAALASNAATVTPRYAAVVLLGAGAKVLGNITVGEGAKVGAGSIVLEDVPPYTTVVGNPARVVGVRHTTMPAFTMDQSLPPLDYVI